LTKFGFWCLKLTVIVKSKRPLTVVGLQLKDSKAAIKVKLSANGLANIQTQNDFEFIIGESHHRCPSFIADFLSPKLARLHAIDPTINKFVISTSDRHCDFDSFLSLGRGNAISISSSNRDFMVSLSSELENRELSFLIFNSTLKGIEITRENVFQHLSDFSHFDSDFTHEIAFIASHFHEFSKSELSSLSLSILSEILSSNELKITSEDQLYEVVWSFVARDRSNFSLFSFVRFEYLSASIIGRFIESAPSFLDLFNSSIWSSLSHRLLLPVSPAIPNSRLSIPEIHGRLFSLTSDSPPHFDVRCEMIPFSG
jgi:hypothetical protein